MSTHCGLVINHGPSCNHYLPRVDHPLHMIPRVSYPLLLITQQFDYSGVSTHRGVMLRVATMHHPGTIFYNQWTKLCPECTMDTRDGKPTQHLCTVVDREYLLQFRDIGIG
jgi:hypothetical protein